jgi:hypothetical protein
MTFWFIIAGADEKPLFSTHGAGVSFQKDKPVLACVKSALRRQAGLCRIRADDQQFPTCFSMHTAYGI